MYEGTRKMSNRNTGGTVTQQMRIRYFVMNLIYRSVGKSVRVPSTRELSKRFGIARSTVQMAFEKLLHDGYIISRPGAATMTNPLSSFMLQPQTKNPLIGVKLYNGDSFYYGCKLWRSLSSMAEELTERSFNIRVLGNSSTSPEAIAREIAECYLDGMILINSEQEYVNAVRRSLPCVLVTETEPDGSDATIHLSVNRALRQLSDRLLREQRTQCLDIVNHFDIDKVTPCNDYLRSLNPHLTFRQTALDGLQDELQRHPPQVIFHFEQYAELLQKMVEQTKRDILLVCRTEPARRMYYRGLYIQYPQTEVAAAAVDMLESLLAGKEGGSAMTFEAELRTREKPNMGEF